MLHEVEVSCLPLEIPEALTADISGMQIHDILHVSDITAPAGVEILTHAEESRRLASPAYAELAALQIARGVERYCERRGTLVAGRLP